MWSLPIVCSVLLVCGVFTTNGESGEEQMWCVCVRGLYCVQTMVDCEVWGGGKCEERSGCEGERRTGCEDERTGCEGERTGCEGEEL